MIIFSREEWAVFKYDETVPERHGALCPPSPNLPNPGTYVLLHRGAEPSSHSLPLFHIVLQMVPLSLWVLSARIRHPTISNSPLKGMAHTFVCINHIANFCRQSTTKDVYGPATLVALSPASRLLEIITVTSRPPTFFHARMASMCVYHHFMRWFV